MHKKKEKRTHEGMIKKLSSFCSLRSVTVLQMCKLLHFLVFCILFVCVVTWAICSRT